MARPGAQIAPGAPEALGPGLTTRQIPGALAAGHRPRPIIPTAKSWALPLYAPQIPEFSVGPKKYFQL
jgi:hypothetical protein